MATDQQVRRALNAVTTAAVAEATALIGPDGADTRDRLLNVTPGIISYYSDGSAALAADHYDDLREASAPRRLYVAEPIVDLRDDKIRTGVLWSVDPLFGDDPDEVLATARLTEIVQYETANPFRDTITTNTSRDPHARGWRRVTSGGCSFCQMLAGRGAVYRAESAHFASHPHCKCTASPVFVGQQGDDASEIQYLASSERSAAEQQELRDYLAAHPAD